MKHCFKWACGFGMNYYDSADGKEIWVTGPSLYNQAGAKITFIDPETLQEVSMSLQQYADSGGHKFDFLNGELVSYWKGPWVMQSPARLGRPKTIMSYMAAPAVLAA